MTTILDILATAIKNKKCVTFYYHNLQRIIEPHHCGILNNTPQLHAYQIAGLSESGGLPEWRNFKIENIRSLMLSDKNFTVQSSYHPANSHYTEILFAVENQAVRSE